MVSVKKISRKIVYMGNFIAESASYFSNIILNLILTAFIEIKISEKKNFLSWKKIFSEADL